MRFVLEGQLHMHQQTRALSFNGTSLDKVIEALLPENYRCACRDHGDPVRITIEPTENEQ